MKTWLLDNWANVLFGITVLLILLGIAPMEYGPDRCSHLLTAAERMRVMERANLAKRGEMGLSYEPEEVAAMLDRQDLLAKVHRECKGAK